MKRLLSALLLSALLIGSGAARAEGPTLPPKGSWADESIYFIFLDRFNNGDKSNDQGVNPNDPRAWHGGDIQGVIDKLDYIKSLGFTAIWITPHVKNSGNDYHGYGAIDFFATDPHFGTIAKTKELVDRAHARGLKVLFDIVVNHTGPNSPLVAEHPDWFHPHKAISNWNDQTQVQEGWIFDLPDFDQSKPEVRAYLLAYSKFWIEQTGVDGFRLDTVRHIPAEFFTWYTKELTKIKPNFWVIGEVWESAPLKLEQYQKAGVNALLDFPVDMAARATFGKDSSMKALADAITFDTQMMDDPYNMGGFLDNHDMARFVTDANQDDPVGRLKLGLTFLFTQRSIPILYYGTEVAMKGGNDPFNRNDFPWGLDEHTDVRTQVTLLNSVRQNHEALRRGTFDLVLADQWHMAYSRKSGQDQVLVVLNNHATDRFTTPIDVTSTSVPNGTRLKDELSGKSVVVVNGQITPDLGARAGAIYTVVPQGGKYPVALWISLSVIAFLIGFSALRPKRRSR